MPDGWSRLVDAGQLADRRTDIEFRIPLAQLPRVAPQLARAEGNADGVASFGREQGLAVVALTVEAALPLVCQRCLRPMSLPVASRTKVVVVESAQAAERVPPEFEAVVADEGRIAVRELVDEELLLALPVVALHEDPAQCVVADMQVAALRASDQDEELTQKPFAGLEGLLKRD